MAACAVKRMVVIVALTAASWCALAAPSVAAPGDWLGDGVWAPNNTVFDTASANGTLYLAGAFGSVGENTGLAAPIDMTTGEATSEPYPRVYEHRSPPSVGSGRVNFILPDGEGGWFLGGEFTDVGGLPRKNLAHILDDGSVDPAFAPTVDKPVRHMALSGQTLVIAGEFASVSGHVRHNLAALDVTDGSVLDWSPTIVSLSGSTTTATYVQIRNGIVYVAGNFHLANGQTRSSLAAFSLSDGSVTDWAPRLDRSGPGSGEVSSFLIRGATMYVAGRFTAVGGVPRTGAAAVDLGSGALLPWNPQLSHTGTSIPSEVGAIFADSHGLYLSGHFNRVNGAVHDSVVRVDETTGAPDSWAPPITSSRSDSVLSVSVAGVFDGKLLIAGTALYGGELREQSFVDETTGAVLPTALSSRFAQVATIAEQDGRYYAGGGSWSMRGSDRRGLAAIDLGTGRPTSWAPNVGATLIETDGDRVYAYDDAADRVRAFDAQTGSPTGWSSVTLPNVTQMELTGGRLLALDQNGRQLLSVSTVTGAAVPVGPITLPGERYLQFAVSGNIVYLGGRFSRLDGKYRDNLAAVNLGNGKLTTWNPRATIADLDYADQAEVSALAIRGSTVYFSGLFDQVGDADRYVLAAVAAGTGQVRPWDPDLDIEPVNRLAVVGSTIYAYGSPAPADGASVLALWAGGGHGDQLVDWNSSLDGHVRSLSFVSDSLFLAGSFQFVGSHRIGTLAQFEAPAVPPFADYEPSEGTPPPDAPDGPDPDREPPIDPDPDPDPGLGAYPDPPSTGVLSGGATPTRLPRPVIAVIDRVPPVMGPVRALSKSRKVRQLSIVTSESGRATITYRRKVGKRYKLVDTQYVALNAGANSIKTRKLAKGIYRVTVGVRDAAGNAAISKTITFKTS